MSPAPSAEAESGLRRYFIRNFLAHTIEGGIFMGALAFVNASTIMPSVVRSLDGPTWLVSLMPIMMMFGFTVPPVFTAHIIDRLRYYKPVLVATGVFQRLPYLAAGLGLIFLAAGSPMLGLAAVALAPLLSGAMGGLSTTAWQQLVIRTIPQNRLSSLFAARFIVASLICLVAAWAVKVVLDAHPDTSGYGILHLLAFGALVVSWLIFLLIREPEAPPPHPQPLGLRDNLRGMPALLAKERNLRRFVLMRTFGNGVFILVPFLAIHARLLLSRDESYLGDLLIVQTIGGILANFLSGYIGDRYGGKPATMMGQAAFIVLAAWSAFATTDGEFRVIFFLFGFALTAQAVGVSTLGLSICPARTRATYLSILAFANLPSMLAASAVSSLVWHGPATIGWLVVLTVACLVLSQAFLVRLKEPHGTLSPR
jgi:MFS family permease